MENLNIGKTDIKKTRSPSISTWAIRTSKTSLKNTYRRKTQPFCNLVVGTQSLVRSFAMTVTWLFKMLIFHSTLWNKCKNIIKKRKGSKPCLSNKWTLKVCNMKIKRLMSASIKHVLIPFCVVRIRLIQLPKC